MLNKAELQKFFLLENDPQLFETALRPRSCGGNAEFEQLALYGDSVLDMHLYDYLTSKEIILSGQITEKKKTVHKALVIKTFAEEILGLHAILCPLDRNYQPGDRDLAETFEALLGAAYKANGIEKCKLAVYSFLDFTFNRQQELREQKAFDQSQDYKSKLFCLFKEAHLEEPDIEPDKVDWTDGSHTYQFDWQVIFKEKRYEICTQQWPNKLTAEQEAA